MHWCFNFVSNAYHVNCLKFTELKDVGKKETHDSTPCTIDVDDHKDIPIIHISDDEQVQYIILIC